MNCEATLLNSCPNPGQNLLVVRVVFSNLPQELKLVRRYRMTHSRARRNSTHANTSSSFTKFRWILHHLVLHVFLVQSANLNCIFSVVLPLPLPTAVCLINRLAHGFQHTLPHYSPTVVAPYTPLPLQVHDKDITQTQQQFTFSILLNLSVTSNSNIFESCLPTPFTETVSSSRTRDLTIPGRKLGIGLDPRWNKGSRREGSKGQ